MKRYMLMMNAMTTYVHRTCQLYSGWRYLTVGLTDPWVAVEV